MVGEKCKGCGQSEKWRNVKENGCGWRKHLTL